MDPSPEPTASGRAPGGASANRPSARATVCWRVRGQVQGVGFRPFVYRLARELGLSGWVRNSPAGVEIAASGNPASLEALAARLRAEAPPAARILALEPAGDIPPIETGEFLILESAGGDDRSAPILPDLATCDDCLREIFDPADRRYGYPFANCTRCGPRYSILLGVPYDRANTTMRAFAMCPRCRAEYENPEDRRFHAQPVACPDCGPQLAWRDADGHPRATRAEALAAAITALRAGKIVAAQGLGGFHLFVDARDEEAVRRLRRRKHREEKPLALMFPDLASAAAACRIDSEERALLLSPTAPIVLLRRRDHTGLADAVAGANPDLGVMLPYTPLHHLLLRALGFPLVATSGNRSDEPICTRPEEAVARLAGIADAFLVHDRPIARRVEDSVARVVAGRPMILRRGRGLAPSSLPLPGAGLDAPTLAVGAHLKNTVAFGIGGRAFLGPHGGDLDTPEARAAFDESVGALPTLYGVSPARVAADLHPDYHSGRYAAGSGLPVSGVQHHHAHVAACAAEHALEGPLLGVAWDGTGYGTDGTVWGGEFLVVDGARFERVAHLRTFRLPGGELAVREPRRSAAGMLFALGGEAGFAADDLPPFAGWNAAQRKLLADVLRRGVNAPPTSSAGRWFDAVASLLGIRQTSSFEGQAAMELEWACAEGPAEPYPFGLEGRTIEWGPAMQAMVGDIRSGVARGLIAARFHETLAAIIGAVARRCGLGRVILTGGCFQNRRLLERAIAVLRKDGREVYWPREVPPNDGGIAYGQLAVASAGALGTKKPATSRA